MAVNDVSKMLEIHPFFGKVALCSVQRFDSLISLKGLHHLYPYGNLLDTTYTKY